MKYLVIDAMLNGSGIRDKYAGGYLAPEDLGLSKVIIQCLNAWLSKYADEHYKGYIDVASIDELDKEGKEIALMIKRELQDVKMEYYSDARMTSEMISV